jgi:hypothetical protein
VEGEEEVKGSWEASLEWRRGRTEGADEGIVDEEEGGGRVGARRGSGGGVAEGVEEGASEAEGRGGRMGAEGAGVSGTFVFAGTVAESGSSVTERRGGRPGERMDVAVAAEKGAVEEEEEVGAFSSPLLGEGEGERFTQAG